MFDDYTTKVLEIYPELHELLVFELIKIIETMKSAKLDAFGSKIAVIELIGQDRWAEIVKAYGRRTTFVAGDPPSNWGWGFAGS